jgi:adenylate cyclase
MGLSWNEIDAKRNENLAIAAKHPSPTYYQIVAQLLTRAHKSDEAITGLPCRRPWRSIPAIPIPSTG